MRIGFYINLERREDRRILMNKNWEGVVRLNRVLAEEDDEITTKNIYNSHRKTIQVLFDHFPEKRYMIFEDDAVPCGDFNKRLKIVEQELPQDWAVLMLGFCTPPNSKFEKVSSHISKAVEGICGQHSYIVNPEFYPTLLEYFDKPEFEVNLDLLFHQLQKDYNVYLATPALTYQAQSYSDNSKSNDSIISENSKKHFKEWMD